MRKEIANFFKNVEKQKYGIALGFVIGFFFFLVISELITGITFFLTLFDTALLTILFFKFIGIKQDVGIPTLPNPSRKGCSECGSPGRHFKWCSKGGKKK